MWSCSLSGVFTTECFQFFIIVLPVCVLICFHKNFDTVGWVEGHLARKKISHHQFPKCSLQNSEGPGVEEYISLTPF